MCQAAAARSSACLPVTCARVRSGYYNVDRVSRLHPAGSRLLNRLLTEGRITPDQYERATNQAKRTGERAEDALIDTGALDEPTLLKYLAGVYKTRFVTTEKLAHADIEPVLLKMLPRKNAERLNVFPILFDQKANSLSIVAVDLEDDVAKQVMLLTNVRDVKVYVARPAAIRALIQKHYGGDPLAFAMLDNSQAAAYQQAFASYDQNVLTEELFALAGPATQARSPVADKDLEKLATKVSRGTSPGVFKRDSSRPAPSGPPPSLSPLAFGPPSASEDRVSPDDYLRTVSVLVSLLEAARPELKGHSAIVAGLCGRICERVGLSPREKHGVLVAAYLHDVGKGNTYHLTALNVAEYEGHRIQAQKTYATPVRLLESASLPEVTVETLSHMYERADGSGFPDRRSGKEIPLGARILAIVETYADLTQNARNPFRKTLLPKDAWEAISKLRGAVFDPNLVDLFQVVVLGEDMRAKLLADRPCALLVDPDSEETTVLELRLIELGFDVAIARTSTDARRAIEQQDMDIIISEVELQPFDGFALLGQIRQSANAKDVPLLFVTRRGDRDAVNRGFALGASDYLVKPTSADVVAAKARQLVEGGGARGRTRGTRGVSGSLREMGLPDVVQILSHGRKTGQLKITASGKSGELHFSEGQIHYATFGELRGEEAVYAMLQLDDGDFGLEPNVAPAGRTIHASTESLLLEGMRRLDEVRR